MLRAKEAAVLLGRSVGAAPRCRAAHRWSELDEPHACVVRTAAVGCVVRDERTQRVLTPGAMLQERPLRRTG